MKQEDLQNLTNEEIRGVLNGTTPYPKVIYDYIHSDNLYYINGINPDQHRRLQRVLTILGIIVVQRFRKGLLN